MEETLGKRIVANRKRLGLTQDALAELLGVTAQAVSKWENDQSCPDITMLPKLAEIFSVSTDELLGLKVREVHVAEIVPEEKERDDEPEGIHVENGTWEFQWDGSRKSSIGIALWLLLTGGLAMASAFLNWGVDTWHIFWSSGLMVFGLFGLYPKFSGFRLGCFLFGGYFLLWHLNALPPAITVLQWEIVLPAALLLFGLCTLVDSFTKPKKGRFHVNHNGKSIGDSAKNYCHLGGECFDCATSFGSNDHLIQLPRLSGGTANVSFGEMTVDLSGCEEFSEGCTVELNCSFGELEILVPRCCRVEPASSTAFAAVETKGAPDPNAAATLHLNCNVSFGEITIRYI